MLFTMLHKAILASRLLSKSLRVAIQMKTVEHYFPVVLLIIMNKVVIYLSSLWIKTII